jgi:GT2 family glycosyltransferase
MPFLTVITVWYKSEIAIDTMLDGWHSSFRASQPMASLAVAENSDHSLIRNVVMAKMASAGTSMFTVPLHGNPGFAKAINQLAHTATSEWILLLNPDVALNDNSLLAIIDQARNMDDLRESVGALSLKTKGTHHCGIEWSPLGFFRDRTIKSRRPLVGPSGGAMLIKRSLFLELGGFNEGLFMWGEDAEFALRLSRLGHKTREISLGLEHVGGHSIADLSDRKAKAFFMARNRLFILRTMFSLKYRILHSLVIFTVMLVNAFTRKAFDRTLFAYLRGMLVGLRPFAKSSPLATNFPLRAKSNLNPGG